MNKFKFTVGPEPHLLNIYCVPGTVPGAYRSRPHSVLWGPRHREVRRGALTPKEDPTSHDLPGLATILGAQAPQRSGP